MTIEKIKQLCHAEPFRPFVIHFPNGRGIDVVHPDYVALAPSGRLISVFQPDDSESLIDLMLVSDVTIKGRARGNGKH
ncbi:MAG TPA: hypothetical protein VN873_07290 [Candidatus Angelobacter sp.]|nr:hypothetical protein [Candidatus Angelobacter sp.]